MAYRGEVCQECGFPVSYSTGPTWWEAENDHWREVMGGEGGVLCVPCFVRLCQSKGQFVKVRVVLA